MRPLRWLVLCGAWCCGPAAALDIQFRDTTPGGMPPAVLGAFEEAARAWSKRLRDPVTLQLDIGYGHFGANGVLGSATSAYTVVPYAAVRAALRADASSIADRFSARSLEAGPGFSFMASRLDGSHRFDDDRNPCLPGPSAPCDANNTALSLTTANAKALGLAAGLGDGQADGRIVFNAVYSEGWDLDRRDGIRAGAVDFVALAAHEIGHTLGFVSGVDSIDVCTPAIFCALDNADGAEPFAVYTALDLFRFSAAGVRDVRVGQPAGFSVDGGLSLVQGFATGAVHGDGWQASHFLPGQPHLMNPYAWIGQRVDPTPVDLLALDVIGWNLVGVVPEPSAYALWALCGLGLLVTARSQRRAMPGSNFARLVAK